jgi:AraC-like DNA-binding protein
MALIIQKVLFEKLQHHPEWVEFEETFRTLSGYRVRLAEEQPGDGQGQLSAQIDVRGVLVGVLVAEGPKCVRGREKACRHLLTMAAERFASILALSNLHDHERLPGVVLKTCQWIRAHALEQEIRLCEAAAVCGLSAGHLSRLFHRSTGLTFQEYVRRFRLERACELLRTTRQPVTTIAFEAGFQSISQFHRSFKAVYGQAPLEYRKHCS